MQAPQTKWLLAAVCVLCALFLGLTIGDRVGRVFFPTPEEQLTEALLKPHPIRSVDAAAWSKLTLGMTKDEVVSIIGESSDISRRTTPDGSETETWQYGWSDGMLPELLKEPSPRAYLVTFDSEERVASLTEPSGNPPRNE